MRQRIAAVLLAASVLGSIWVFRPLPAEGQESATPPGQYFKLMMARCLSADVTAVTADTLTSPILFSIRDAQFTLDRYARGVDVDALRFTVNDDQMRPLTLRVLLPEDAVRKDDARLQAWERDASLAVGCLSWAWRNDGVDWHR